MRDISRFTESYDRRDQVPSGIPFRKVNGCSIYLVPVHNRASLSRSRKQISVVIEYHGVNRDRQGVETIDSEKEFGFFYKYCFKISFADTFIRNSGELWFIFPEL